MDNGSRLDQRRAADALQRDLSAQSGTRVSRGLIHKMLAAQKT
jgi:hypothetical protein